MIASRPRLVHAFVSLIFGVLVTVTSAAKQESKRVFIVQSYEEGHVCGGPQAEGILKGLAAEGWVDGRNPTV